MGGWLRGLGAGAEGILGQVNQNQQAVAAAAEAARKERLDLADLNARQADARLKQQNALMEQQKQATFKVAIDNIRKTNPQLADILSAGLKPKDLTSPFSGRLFPGVDPASGKPTTMEVNADDPNAVPRTLGLRPETTDKPKKQIVPVFDPATGENVSEVVDLNALNPGDIIGNRAASPTKLRAIDSIKAARDQLTTLKTTVEGLGGDRTTAQAWRDYLYYGALGTEPPDGRAQMITQLGGVLQQLIQAASSSGNLRAYAAIKTFQKHFPQYTDSDALILDKINVLTQPGGILDTLSTSMGTTAGTSGAASASAAPGPVASTGWVLDPLTNKWVAK